MFYSLLFFTFSQYMSSLLEKKWFVYGLGLVFFFAIQRYYGFYEDAGRYLLQVVHFLAPERFADDVPFMYGNQDQFTLYSPLMAVVFKTLGVNVGGIVSMLVLRLLWCIAAISVMIRWCGLFGCRKWALPVFVVCLATLMHKCYGGVASFPILDPILVARYMAFALVLAGFATFFSRKKLVALAFFVVASLIHPLIGGWGIPLWLFYHYGKARWPVLAVVLLFPFTAFLHIGCLDFYPSDWMGGSSPFAPSLVDVFVYGGVLALWFTVARLAKNQPLKRISSSMFWVYLAGMFLHVVGVYMHHQLLVQAQPYRVFLFCVVPLFPVIAAFVNEWQDGGKLFVWAERLNPGRIVSNVVFGAALLLFIVHSLLDSYIQLSLEQGLGSADTVFFAMNLPSLGSVLKIALGILVLVSFSQRRFILFVIFAFSLLNTYATILPMVGIVFYLFGHLLRDSAKRVLASIAAVITFVEFVSSLPNSPLLASSIVPAIFVLTLFALALWIALKKSTLPFVLTIIVVACWDIYAWDARDETRVAYERQADSFWQASIFPQIKERGRMLFAVGDELPLQSRFVFLTGTYADLTIGIGGLFYREQYLEANRRLNLLVYGDETPRHGNNLEKDLENIYTNPDTLVSRMTFLCAKNEITHMATGFAQLSFAKIDSVFLEEMNIPLYLYGCP